MEFARSDPRARAVLIKTALDIFEHLAAMEDSEEQSMLASHCNQAPHECIESQKFFPNTPAFLCGIDLSPLLVVAGRHS